MQDGVWALFLGANINFARQVHRLLPAGRRAVPVPALLVAGRGGAVLSRLAGPDPRRVRPAARQADRRGPAGCRWRCRRAHGASFAVVGARDGHQPGDRLLLHVHPRLGAGVRGSGGGRGDPARPTARRRAECPRLAGSGRRHRRRPSCSPPAPRSPARRPRCPCCRAGTAHGLRGCAGRPRDPVGAGQPRRPASSAGSPTRSTCGTGRSWSCSPPSWTTRRRCSTSAPSRSPSAWPRSRTTPSNSRSSTRGGCCPPRACTGTTTPRTASSAGRGTSRSPASAARLRSGSWPASRSGRASAIPPSSPRRTPHRSRGRSWGGPTAAGPRWIR